MLQSLDDAMTMIETYCAVTGGWPTTMPMTAVEFHDVLADMKERGYYTPEWPGVMTPGGKCTFYVLQK